MGFYIMIKTQVHGPFDDKQIRLGIRSGKLKSNFLISNSKSGPWNTIEQVSKSFNDAGAALEAFHNADPSADQEVNLSSKPPLEPLHGESPPLPSETQPSSPPPLPTNAPSNSYWKRRDFDANTAGLPTTKSQPNPAHSKKYDLRRLKNTEAPQNGSSSGLTPTMIKILSAVSAGVLVLMLLAVVFLLGPFLLQQGEMNRAKEIVKETARHMVRYNQESNMRNPNQILLNNYENRLIDLSRELTEIRDNMSAAELERFKKWMLDEGVEYAYERGLN